MEDHPAHRFGTRPPMALPDVPVDAAFLSWGGDANAAVVLAAQIEDYLLEDNGDSPSDHLDRYFLTLSLAKQWRALKGDSGFIRYFTALSEISHDAERLQAWRGAVVRIDQGSSVHGSEPVRALELYTDALKTFEMLGDEKGAGRCHGNIGHLLRLHGQLEDSVRECTAALDLHIGLSFNRGCLLHLYNLLEAAREQQRWDDALEISRLRQVFLDRANPTVVAAATSAIGWCALQLGDREEAERAYEEAVASLRRVQTAPALRAQLEVLGPLAHALGRVPDLQATLPSIQEGINLGLRTLDVVSFPSAEAILRRFREALARGDDQEIYQSLATSEAWSSLAFERALAGQAIAGLVNDSAVRDEWGRVARRLAFSYCRAFLDRGPFDEHALYATWTDEQRIAKAKAFACKVAAIRQASGGEIDAAHASLATAFELHDLIGDRDLSGSWFPEAARELQVPAAAHTQMHTLMMQAAQANSLGRADDETRLLLELLGVASEQGTTLNVADAHVRLGIHHFQCGRMADAATWFAGAEDAFRRLERIGVSVREETGRSHNRLKFAAHLVEFLEQDGRYQEVPFVAVPAIREADWFIETFPNPDYAMRATEYKSRLLYSAARACERLGSYEQSLTHAEALLEWSARIGDARTTAVGQQAKAAALKSMNRFAEALTCASADLELQLGFGNDREIAVALVLCADLHMETGDHARARDLANQAIVRAGDNPASAPQARDARYLLARLAEREGANPEARRLFAEVVAEEQTAAGPEWITAATALAQRLLADGDGAHALPIAERAWKSAADVPSLPLRVAAGYVWAKCLLDREAGPDDVNNAIDVLLECCRMSESMRGAITDEWHKASLAVTQTAPFELLLSVLMAVVRVAPTPAWKRLAFNVAERAKARALAESIAASAAREADHDAVRLGGVTIRTIDPREEILAADFEKVRDMLRRDAAPAERGGAAAQA